MNDPEEPADAPEPPGELPAVQWMMQQAAAGQSAASLPAWSGQLPVSGLAPAPAEAALVARRQRIADALRGNARLTDGLPDAAAEALVALGLDMARRVIDDTAGLDDAAAEDILQPRVRAVRRLIMAATATIVEGRPATEAAGEWTRQASLALGDGFAPPGDAAERVLNDGWRVAAGRPAEQIALLRGFIETGIRR